MGGRVDRAARPGDHHHRLHRRSEAPGQRPGRARRPAVRHLDRLDRRLHVRPRRRAGRQGHRDRPPGLRARQAPRRPRGHQPTAGHRHPVGDLQLLRGDEQRRERRLRRGRLQPPARAARRRHRRGRRLRDGLPVPARRVHRPARLEGGRRPDLLLAGHRRADLPALHARHVPAAVGAAADPGDRPRAPVHRPRDRRAGVHRGAEGALPRDRARDDPEHRGLGLRARGQRARRRRHQRERGRGRGARQRRGHLRRPADARPGRGALRHGARGDRGLPHRPHLPPGRHRVRGRRRPHARRADPRRGGRLVHLRAARRPRLRARRDRLPRRPRPAGAGARARPRRPARHRRRGVRGRRRAHPTVRARAVHPARRGGGGPGARVSDARSLPTDAVVLVHGVGFGPDTLAPVAAFLGPAAGVERVLVLERRGYGARAAAVPAATVGEHVDDLVELLDAHGVDRAVVAGTSGGATVALAAALLAPGRVARAVVHEPAVGTLSPDLRRLVRGALQDGGGLGLVRALAGATTWEALDEERRAAVSARAALVERDAPAFLAWEPPLGRTLLAAPVVCTVGDRSPPLRHDIARRLGHLLDAPVEVLPDCGHLAQLDAPATFAAAVARAAQPAPTPTSTPRSTA
ncbi:alpha/beta fold hydrolase [Conexibacter sp. W3-3-2]|nr:alpha/beta fold hydrolase [Conexibacter sp. W3-3-2]